ncbi:MAG: hypothetical protein A3G27_01795 [Betaproteobacteria bacterium RIFCSPLOWO2_12_FULL_66_14]|nr:MAG: hypothetical protein A3G27_01795 [Betaproteobacteria bacterium RIFCSPLOWO2_12_FULL_66_14]
MADDDRMSAMMLGLTLEHWEQVESYITEHTDARFSHGICPSCLATAMAELDAPAVPSPKSGA